MVVNGFWVLSLVVENKHLGIRLEKIYAGKKKTKFSWIRQGIILQRDSKGTFYNGNESDESYNENKEQQQLPQGFTSSCYKIASPILL